MKNESPQVTLHADEKTRKLTAVVHLMREAGFSDGFFSPEEQAVFMAELDQIELDIFKGTSHEELSAMIARLDGEIKQHGVEAVTKKSLALVTEKELKERVFTAALHIARSGGAVVPEEIQYLKRLKEKFHFTEGQVEGLVKKAIR